MTNTLHAHVSTSQRDCDGPTYDTYVTTFNDDELASKAAGEARGYNDFSDLEFKARVLSNAASFHAEGMDIHISPTGFRYHEVTDEGFRSGEVVWCEDDCDTGERTHRDVYAEQMGY